MPLQLLLASLLACQSASVLDQPTPTREDRPGRVEPTATLLARRTDVAFDVSLPPTNRPKPAPDRIGLTGPLERVQEADAVVIYRAPLPLRADLMPDKLRGTHTFGSAPPEGFVVRSPDRVWAFDRGARQPYSYAFDRDWLYLGVPGGSDPPKSEDVHLSFPRATEAETALNRVGFEGEDAGFLTRNITIDAVSTTGLYLPAPAEARWEVTVPERGVFATRVQVLPPAIQTGEASDGATLVAELLDGDQVVARAEVEAEVGAWSELRLDLQDQAGEDRVLRLATEPGDSAMFDYVFLEEPALYRSSESPRRTVVLFVDTLRADHVGTYGYGRATTPFVDRWATHAAVFGQARSVAPWTLPSARAALSGHQPEDWYAVENLAERFADAGWATEAVIANAFLSQPFDMHRGWGRYRYEHLMAAPEVSAAALEALDRHADRDLVLLVHFMDPHLPYEEPFPYRYRFTWGNSPDGKAPARARLYGADLQGAELDAMKRYVEARYDQNIRYVDDHLRPILEAAGPDATAVLFSDHGEELWDHGSFEHGHSFYDEVLRVPLVIRSPHAPPGRYDDPVSLLDLTPTLLELAGIEPGHGPGRSLVGRMYGVDGEAEALAERPQAFGRPLYEQDGWAVLEGGHKWIDRAGVRRVHDLGSDPGERTDVASAVDLDRFPDALSQALDLEVHTTWRLRPKTRKAHDTVAIRITHPEGFERAWKSYDPRGRSADVTVRVVEGAVLVHKPAGVDMPNAVMMVPQSWDSPAGLVVEASSPGMPELLEGCELEGIPAGPERHVLLEGGEKGWAFLVDTASAPEPSGVEVRGFAPDAADQLKELGYLDE